MSIVHIPFYPSDWLAGTRGLSDAETGVYITLIATMYEMAGPIERNDDRLFRLCGCKSKATFVKVLGYLMSQGKIIEEDGFLYNEKVAKVVKETTEKSSKAKIAAQSRWSRKSNKNNDSDDAVASSEHMPQTCQPKPEEKEDTNVSSKKLTSESARGRRLGADWALPRSLGLWAISEFSLSEREVRQMADEFKDYWIGVPGQRGVKLNWEATWRNWVRKNAPSLKKSKTEPGQFGAFGKIPERC